MTVKISIDTQTLAKYSAIEAERVLREFADGVAEVDILAILGEASRIRDSRQDMANIPNWATWDEQQANDWGQTNIGTPLLNARTNLDALQTLSLVTFKAAMNTILDILDAMWTAQQAFGRMLIALRDKNYPNL